MNTEDKLQEYEIQELKERLKKKEEMLDNEISEIKEMMKPLLETYTVAVYLGKWLMGTLVFISILLGIILAVQKLWK